MNYKRLWTATIMALAALSPLHADIDEEVFALENIQEAPNKVGLFRLEGEFDSITKAHFNKKGYEDQSISFAEYSASLNTIFLAMPCTREFYSIAVGYSRTHLCWKENPYFCEENFNTGTVALRFYSNRLCDWVWQGQLGMNISLDHFDFNNYLTFDLLLWGRYDYLCNMGLHFGILAMTGMRMDRVYPVIGFDWSFCDCWKLNAIFPTNVSLEYQYSKQLTPFLALRFIDVRHRAGRNEPLPYALINYKNIGAEAGIQYENGDWMTGNIHAGSTVGGKLRIANKQNRSPRHFKIDPSFYLGGELVFKF